MTPRRLAALGAGLAALGRRADAYWHASLCDGPGDPLCAAPWVHEEAPVLSWAPLPGKCLTLPKDGAGKGAPLHLRDCAPGGERQHLLIERGGGRSLLRLKDEPSSCVGVAAAQAVLLGDAEHGKRLTRTDCGDGSGEEVLFELPRRGQGAIRWVGKGNLCLTVKDQELATVVEESSDGSGEIAEGTRMVFPVSLETCEDGLQSQVFISPRDLGGSAFVGVNLGGWLVLEEWMWRAEMSTQGIRDEWSLIAKYGGPTSPRAQKVMHRHWDNFLREEHLDRLARFGVTHVRIPIGYWLLDYNVSDGFVDGGKRYLDRALRWLKKRRMKAVLDLHALPGGQAVDGFTGRRFENATFFLEEHHFQRGKEAVEKLADLILAYEEQTSTSGVVMGIELLNEPMHDHWDAPMGIRAFYEEMVPRVRRKLAADRYMVLLCFMDSPHTATADWLAEARRKDPDSFAGVVYDTHLYHLFGDNTDPWTPGQDMCKTCCRDPHLLKPMFSNKVPSVIGEYSMSTGFPGWEQEGFERTHLENQWSMFNTTSAVVGSFTWNFRIILDDDMPTMYMEWSLLDMISSGFLAPDGVYASDLSQLCPKLGDWVQLECPPFENTTVTWTTRCEWENRSKASEGGEDGRGLRATDLSLEEGESMVELAAAVRRCGGRRFEWLVHAISAVVLFRLGAAASF